ncbi:alpha/beta fold hydrolase [Crossiella cryophila]|uniref:Pimeloyl-ACP methyl ester carboxylesterase n=1 Tax=Crossiella cryophila TaxID=43355 RepID=A0A7W7CB30_9PSEU|nr:alpha/beta hydrolase [Crossiella cryophila]MBB4677864.1 pimeloyl-ACP methyl ester carboxylesterase [Crossiella cryophila]
MRKIIAAVTAATLLAAGAAQPVAAEPVAGPGRGHYVEVNGLRSYYEVHGHGRGVPLVLLHGAFSATGTSFAEVLPRLARGRKIISVELQGHGHTADIDRPLTLPGMADDTAALLRAIGVPQADVFGYSMGAGVALSLALRHPGQVRKAVLASVAYTLDGMHPGMVESMENLKPENLMQSPYYAEYVRIAPRPQDFPRLVEKVKNYLRAFPRITPEQLRAMTSPVLLIAADSDIIRLAHTVELFTHFGGGVNGDVTGLPKSRLAVLPATKHTTVTSQPALLFPLIPDFLGAP